MSETPTDEIPTTDPPSTDAGTSPEPGFTTPHSDREPTPDEERIAEEMAQEVDLERVAEHYDDAMRTGAAVRGEGQIEPS